MKKQTKLVEKASRIPDTRQVHWGEIISKYLQDIEPLTSESARSHRFSILLQQLLGTTPDFIESYVEGMEKYIRVREKDRLLRGRADHLFGNVLIEFERSIPKNRAQAEVQMRNYTAILWSQESPDTRRPYICIATDGVRFLTYSPTLTDLSVREVAPDEVILRVLEEVDWTKFKPQEIFYWLDRYFLRKEILHPTSEMIVHDFGVKSHAFQTTRHTLLALWQGEKQKSDFAVIYESWEKYLRIVYGSEVTGDELFIRHTYLATLAKLMSWMRISESTSLPDDAQIIAMLEGRLFKAQGIENFIEEDFFSWLARAAAVDAGVGVTRWLFSLLQSYNLRELSEDVLKSLYQELVDPDTRHDLGEFYTPDWLAHRMVNRLLNTNPTGSLLDPACGSGTFLYLAIREKRNKLGDSIKTLRHILNSVYGADIHPLAVIIAKTNYILALGDLMKKRGKGTITIPIYLADTLRIPERFMRGPQYQVRINSQTIYIPEGLLKDLSLYDQAIELAKKFASQNKGKEIVFDQFRNFLEAQHFQDKNNDVLVEAIFAIAKTLKRFIDANRDTIWAFVLKNTYMPLFFKSKFDFVVGNPPWLAFRFMEPSYQKYLKRQITEEYQLILRRGELITHLEMATLFLLMAADLYLKSGGTIGFVLPKSIFSADQHDGLRRSTFTFSEDMKYILLWHELWDLENVSPLFNVPACVLVAKKGDYGKRAFNRDNPIAGKIYSGILESKNASLDEAARVLAVEEGVQFSLHTRGKRSFWSTGKSAAVQVASYYKTRFAQGATIVPRTFWFAKVKSSPLGFDPTLPPLQSVITSKAGPVKDYKDIRIDGNVESRFLYCTLLGDDLLPFGYRNLRIVLLPIEPEGVRHRLIGTDEARQHGFLHLAQWLAKAEAEWAKARGEKAERMSIYERLDRVHSLSRQNPQAKYRVVYPNFQRVSLASVVSTEKTLVHEINQQRLELTGFVVESALYHCETNNVEEAYYLCTCLNSSLIDLRLGPLRRRAQKTHPNVHKKIFDVAPIPQFDAANRTHHRLAALGAECSAKVEQWVEADRPTHIKSIGKLRSLVRDELTGELTEIDRLVKEILQ